MEDQLFNSILAGLSGGVPLAVPMFIYLHMTLKNLTERDRDKDSKISKLENDVTHIKVEYASDAKAMERLKLLKTHGMVP